MDWNMVAILALQRSVQGHRAIHHSDGRRNLDTTTQSTAVSFKLWHNNRVAHENQLTEKPLRTICNRLKDLPSDYAARGGKLDPKRSSGRLEHQTMVL